MCSEFSTDCKVSRLETISTRRQKQCRKDPSINPSAIFCALLDDCPLSSWRRNNNQTHTPTHVRDSHEREFVELISSSSVLLCYVFSSDVVPQRHGKHYHAWLSDRCAIHLFAFSISSPSVTCLSYCCCCCWLDTQNTARDESSSMWKYRGAMHHAQSSSGSCWETVGPSRPAQRKCVLQNMDNQVNQSPISHCSNYIYIDHRYSSTIVYPLQIPQHTDYPMFRGK